MKKIQIDIPKSLRAIKLREYQRFLKLADENKDAEDPEFLNLKMLEIFCGLTLKEAYNMKLTDFSFVINHLNELFQAKTPFINRFSLSDPNGDEVEFGFIPKLDNISLGEFVDLDSYMSDWDNMHKAMAVLYRPVTFSKKNMYLIEDYESSDKYSEALKDMPIDIVLGALVFFLSFRKRTVSLFDGLFTESSNEVSLNSEANFGRKWGWYQSIYAIAQGDLLRFEAVTKLPVRQALTWLEFEREKNELEAKRIQKIK